MNVVLLLSIFGMNQCLTFSNADIQISVISKLNEANENGSSLAVHQLSSVPNTSTQVVIPDAATVDKMFSKERLNDIFKISKNISHSKGHLVKNKDGEIEFRRSMSRKIIESANSLALKKWLHILETNSTAQLQALNELEFLVHQYETALNFKNLGGIDLTFSYVKHENLSIASGALSVVTAAMQGNPDIQKYMEKFHVIEHLLEVLSLRNGSSVRGSLYALSSYLRNMPSHQAEFLSNNGLNVFKKFLRHYSGLRYKVKVIDLLGDLAKEIYAAFYENGDENGNLQQIFAKGIADNDICGEIPYYLQFEDFILHEKIVTAMNALSIICHEDFHKEHVIKSIEKLREYYNPNESGTLHSSIDKELKLSIYEELNILLKKITSHEHENTAKKVEL